MPTKKKSRPVRNEPPPVAAWFLGPKAEQADVWQGMLNYIFQDYVHWRRNYFPEDPIGISRLRRRKHEAWFDGLNSRIDWLLGELKAHYPFYSPRYIAHMLSEQTLPSVVGYFAGMLYNPNNVTDEAAPVTVQLELEVGKIVAEMIGYNPKRAWAHICSGGTTANLEALWVARTVQFIPLIVQELCKEQRIQFSIKVPDGRQADIGDLSTAELMGLKTNEAIFMLRKLAKHMIIELGQSQPEVIQRLTSAVRASEFNPALRGIAQLLRRIDMEPKIFVSAAAHYSIKKCANLLGYGEEAVHLIPVTERFRLNVDLLGEQIRALKSDQYIAAVIGIVGTTEEGAVDPIHRIRFLQTELNAAANRSFWLHVDAAWGGYFRSLFCGHTFPERRAAPSLKAICRNYARRIGAKEKVSIQGVQANLDVTEKWNDSEVYSAFLAMPDADSVTIDPHKMGYVPYPAGIIAFRNGLVTELMAQEAQYISEKQEGIQSIDEPMEIKAVGPYVLEGSKPGAAAAACWLAHTAIPLTIAGHGEMMKRSLLKARKLTRYLLHHRHMFRSIDVEFCGVDAHCNYPFTFVPLYDPDTNVVCFVVTPMSWQKRALVSTDTGLLRLNQINAEMYHELTLIKNSSPQSDAKGRRSRLPYGQPYFVSRTRFEERQYSYKSIKYILDKLGVPAKEYATQGLFVLRSAVMNPLYDTAEEEGKDHLLDFVKHAHRLARTIVASAASAQ
jgi:glutamate/tyrosine decarboxylase-like PLP-dependent enzyme